MPGVSQVIFVAQHLVRDSVVGKSILDVGSCNFNGSIKPLLKSFSPSSYVGIDIIEGRDVDKVLHATKIISEFGESSFDIIICLEMLEHAIDWKLCISQMKRAVKPGGKLFLTTRSVGYPVHGFPNDFWRFSVEDMKSAFSDFTIRAVESDGIEPGVFIFAEKPLEYSEVELTSQKIHCVLTGKAEVTIPVNVGENSFYKKLALRQKIRTAFHKTSQQLGKLASKTLLR